MIDIENANKVFDEYVSQFNPENGRIKLKIDHIKRVANMSKKIAEGAAKQSKRSIVPKVLEPISFDEALEGMKQLDLIIVPYENAEGFGIKSLINKLREENTALNKISEVGIFIGPEGGNRILRTETAGFTAASLIQYELGDLGGVI